jgi:O-antigen/teichoic acid export membrane protein
MTEEPTETSPAQSSGSAGSRTILQNFASLAAASIFTRVFTFFGGIYARRILGPLGIGQVNWASALVSYFQLLANPGLDYVARRDVARDPSQTGRMLGRMLSLQIPLAVVGFGLTVVSARLLADSHSAELVAYVAAFSLILVPTDIGWILQAHERMRMVSLLTIIGQLAFVALLVLLVRDSSHGYLYVALNYPIRLATTFILLRSAHHHGLVQWSDVRLGMDGVINLIKEALPFGLSQGSILLYYNIDSIILSANFGNETVGQYSTAYSLMLMPAQMICNTLFQAYYPGLSRAIDDPKAASALNLNYLKLLAWSCLPIATVCVIGGNGLVQMLYGSEFKVAAEIFPLLALDIALVAFNCGMAMPLLAWGRQKTQLKVTSVAALVNLVLNLILIPRFGIWAAVWTTLFAEIMVMVMIFRIRRSLNPIPMGAVMLPCMMVCIIGGLVGFVLSRTIEGPYWIAPLACGLVIAPFVWRATHQDLRTMIGKS